MQHEHTRLRVNQLLPNIGKSLRFVLSLLAFLIGIVNTTLIMLEVEHRTRVVVICFIQNLLLIGLLALFLVVLYCKYRQQCATEKTCQNKLDSLSSTVVKVIRWHSEKFALYFHGVVHVLSEQLCSVNPSSKQSISGVLSTFCDFFSELLKILLSRFHRRNFYIVVLGFVDEHHIKILARSSNSKPDLSNTIGVDSDKIPIPIAGKSAFTSILAKDRETKIWVQDHVPTDGQYRAILGSLESPYAAMIVHPIQAPIRPRQNNTGYRINGFLGVYTPVSNPGTERVFSGNDRRVEKAIEKLMKAFAHLMFLVLNKGKMGGLADMILLAGSEYGVNRAKFTSARSINRDFMSVFHGL